MTKKLNKKKYFDNRFGKLTIDGEIYYEVEAVNAMVETDIEEIQQAGQSNPDYKEGQSRGTGSYRIRKVVTRGKKKRLENIQAGRTSSYDLIVETGGNNTYGNEVALIRNVVMSNLPLVNWDVNNTTWVEETNFVFNPDDVEMKEEVDPAVLG